MAADWTITLKHELGAEMEMDADRDPIVNAKCTCLVFTAVALASTSLRKNQGKDKGIIIYARSLIAQCR